MGEDEYRMGELRGDVNAIKRQLDEIKRMVENTHSTHSQGYGALEERIVSLEKSRARILGGCAVIGGFSALVAGVAKMVGAGLLP